jgi:hypothetical protein
MPKIDVQIDEIVDPLNSLQETPYLSDSDSDSDGCDAPGDDGPSSPLPPSISKPIIRGKGRDLLSPDTSVGARVRIKSVDMRDVRYFSPKGKSCSGFVMGVDGWELKVLDKLDRIAFMGSRDGELLINFLRLYLMCESVRDHWIVTGDFEWVLTELDRDIKEILSSVCNEARKSSMIIELCRKKADKILEQVSNGVLATKMAF